MTGRASEAAAFGGLFLFGVLVLGASAFSVVTLLALRARHLGRAG